MGKVISFRPLTIYELRDRADKGKLTPQDLEQCAWIRRSRRIWAPKTEVETLVKQIADTIRAYREDHHLSAEDFAARTCFQRSFISQIETGHKKAVTLHTIIELLRGCDMRLELDLIPRKRKKKAAYGR